MVGESDSFDPVELGRYRSILWFTRRAPRTLPPGVEAGRLQHECVDDFDETRTGHALDRLIQRDARHLPSVFVAEEAAGEAAPSFHPVIESVFAHLESHQRARTTRQRDGLLWQRHVLANLPAYARHRLPATWSGALTGVPALVCGAGPSLQTSLPALAGAAGRGVILAADSALRALASAGVAPDFTVTVDPTKVPVKCLPPGAVPRGRVIAASVSPPDWQEAVPAGQLYFISGKQLTEDAIEAAGAPRTTIAVEENCGITAVALAVHLGCSPIYLFGLDHAVDSVEPGRLHQRDTEPSAEASLGFKAGRNYPRVPGNYQPEVATPFFREWRRLDAICASRPPGEMVNVTDRGAHFSNTTLVRSSDFSPPPLADKSGWLERIPAAGSIEPLAWETIVAQLCRLSDLGGPPIAAARRVLLQGQPSHAAKILATVFGRREFSLLFGNYSLRILPHLVTPQETPPELWNQLLDECAELVALARLVR